MTVRLFADTYRAVLSAVAAARPSTVLPASSRKALTTDPTSPDWTEDLIRAVHTDLTTTLRGLVEDAGYDPDLLPALAAPSRLLDLDLGDSSAGASAAAQLVLTVPDPDRKFENAVKDVPVLTWRGDRRCYVGPVHPGQVPALRELVRSHRVQVTDRAAAALKVAAAAMSDPAASAWAVLDVTGDQSAPRSHRLTITPVLPAPALADAVKRIPSLTWHPADPSVQGTAGSSSGGVGHYSAPVARLRDAMDYLKPFPHTVTAAVRATLSAKDTPLTYDGTLDGLRKVLLTDLDCVETKRAEKFAEFGIETVYDLLMLTPRRYLDRSRLTPIRSLTPGQEVGLLATVSQVTVDQRRRMVRFTVADASGKLGITFFNAIWQAKRFRVGDEVVIWGRVEEWQGSSRAHLSMSNPIMDPVGDRTLPVVPVYPQSAKTRVTTWEIAQAAGEAIRRLGTLADPLTDDLRAHALQNATGVYQGQPLIGRQEALTAIHTPANLEQADAARVRLAFDELLRMQTALLAMKASEADEVGTAVHPTGVLTSQLLAGLPYPLTGAQTAALDDIDRDLRRPHPMHRLLQGDVGSGKTLVALLTLLKGLEDGFQGALMAPTEILATQLYTELADRARGLTTTNTAGQSVPVRVELFTNKLRGKNRTAALEALAAGDIHIAVGTHALLVDDVQFHRLGVVVVDEQHRFGVEQRATLRAKGPVESTLDGQTVQVRPDMLVMTATPIPRTAAMTVFGDLDLSILDELPPGRTPIATSWLDTDVDLVRASAAPWGALREQVAAGRQAYIVCPLVEESDKLQVASAVETFEQLQHGALAGLRLGLVHGQQNPDDRAATMAAFRDGHLDVLVATTVIEVGVNVPNATIIVILDPARFGIAQLHQLRGRVGRGAHASSCVLLGRCTSTDARTRMEALVESTDGFYLSEVDLSLRGHGQVFGAAQSGQSDLRVADLDTDRELLVAARVLAENLLEGDPRLTRHPLLRTETATVLDPEARAWLTKS